MVIWLPKKVSVLYFKDDFIRKLPNLSLLDQGMLMLANSRCGYVSKYWY